jgi:hypothetical protein
MYITRAIRAAQRGLLAIGDSCHADLHNTDDAVYTAFNSTEGAELAAGKASLSKFQLTRER